MDDDVQKELNELAALADDVLRHEAAAEKSRQAIRERLPGLRAQKVGPARLERTIKSVYVKDTISRWTKAYAPPRGKAGQQDEDA